MPIPYPSNSKLAGTFQLEASPGGNNYTRYIKFDYNNFNGIKLVLDNVITSTEISTNDAVSFRNIYYKLMSLLDNNILYATENSEQMLIRYVSSISFYDPNSQPAMINGDCGYYPYSISFLATRGYNGTTAQTQYGYASGYFSNIYLLQNSYNQPNINPLLSGTVTDLFYGSNQIDLYLNNSGIGSSIVDNIIDKDNFKLRLNMGNDYITSTEMLLIKNGQNHDSLKTRFNNIFGGKVLKVYIPEIDKYEELLINSIESFHVSNENQLCPNDLGYMPDRIKLNVTRGYNGTNIINETYNSSIGIAKGSQSYNNYIINSYVEGTNTFQDNLNEILSNSNDIATLGSFTELLTQQLGLSTNQLNFGTVRDYVNENLIFSDVLVETTVREFLVMVNDLIVLSNNSNNKAEYYNTLTDLIKVFDQSNLLDFVDYFASVREFLQMSLTNSVVDSIQKVLTVIINEYFRLIGDNVSVFAEYFSRSVEFIKLKEDLNLSGDILVQISDNFNLSNSLNNSLETNIIVEEIIRSTFLIEINGEQYECYALNLDNKALTRYTNYNFNSFAHFNNKYYALGEDGLYDLIYTGEDGEEVVSKVKTSFLNISDNGINVLGGLGSLQKTLKTGYFLIKSNGQVGLRVYTDLGDKFDYIVKQEYNENKLRRDFDSGVRGSCFQLELTVFDDFELEQCELIPVIHSKRV